MPSIQAVIHNAPQGVQSSHSNYSWFPPPIPQSPQYIWVPAFIPHRTSLWGSYMSVLTNHHRYNAGIQAVIHHAPQRIEFSHPNSIGVLALIPQGP